MNRGTIPISAEVVKSHGTRRSLKKHEILRGHKQFNRVITGGRSLLGELLRCFVSASGYGEDPGRDIVKVGFTVSRKIRRSTVRNRLKRIMREVYRMHRERLHQLAIRKSQRLELVLLYRGNSDADPKKVPYELIEKDFLRIVDRLERGLDGAGFV
ncbi:MAG: ribonuclease P protein component [Bacteroidota bacterium]